MHNDIKVALKKAILASLPILHEKEGQLTTPYEVWTKVNEGQWRSKPQKRPDFHKILTRNRELLAEAAKGFAALLLTYYPEYGGTVSLVDFGGHRICDSDVYLLDVALRQLYLRCRTFDCDETSVDTIVNEFEEFMDQPTVRIRFQAQLQNYRMTSDNLALPKNLSIRRLSEEEISTIHTTQGFLRPRLSGPYEFVIEGEIEVDKRIEGSTKKENSFLAAPFHMTQTLLDNAILCLRTFKAGQVGFDYVFFKPIKFCPIGLYHCLRGDMNPALGSYRISEEEEIPLREHAVLIFQMNEPAMELACRRLADAETRSQPYDQVIDAVVGMEALLQGGQEYRFSLRYSTLFNTPEERYNAFLEAKDLYRIRSKIAHGSNLSDYKWNVGHKKLKLADAAILAKESLRNIVRMFLPKTKAAPYKKSEFWERAYFGLTEVKDN